MQAEPAPAVTGPSPHVLAHIVAMTGASGAVYGLRLAEELLRRQIPVEMAVSEPGRLVLAQECGIELSGDPGSDRDVLRRPRVALAGRLGLVLGPRRGGPGARVPPGREEQLPDDRFPSHARPAERGEAHHEVPARVAVGHGKDVDLVEEVRPGGDALDAGEQGGCKGRIHVSTPGPG